MEIGNKITFFEAKNREQVVGYFYRKESPEWHRGTHKNKGTCEENIQSTLETVAPDKMYVVYVGIELAAFFTKFDAEDKKVLDGWHIAEKFRNKDFLPKFWELVKEVFEGDILAGLYEQNQTAIEHLYRQGFTMQNKIETKEGNLVILSQLN